MGEIKHGVNKKPCAVLVSSVIFSQPLSLHKSPAPGLSRSPCAVVGLTRAGGDPKGRGAYE